MAAVMLSTACSSIRLAYDNAPRLSWWWLDGYVDFDGEQASQVKEAIADYYAWHRQTQLAPYAVLLDELQAPLLQPTTGAAVCRWQGRFLAALQPAIERALKTTAERLPRLSDSEFEHIAAHNAKKNASFRKDYLQPDLETRAEAAYERNADRAERIYGRLGEAQKAVIRQHVTASRYDPAAALAERQRRQRDTIETLRRLQIEAAGPERRLSALRDLSERTQSSRDPAHRLRQDELRAQNCEFIATLHNTTNPEQRAHARQTAQGYASDLRTLAAAAD